MAIFRITCQGKTVGVIAAVCKTTASAYAIGKYGAGADVEKVATKAAIDGTGLCVIIETKNYLFGDREVRVIV